MGISATVCSITGYLRLSHTQPILFISGANSGREASTAVFSAPGYFFRQSDNRDCYFLFKMLIKPFDFWLMCNLSSPCAFRNISHVDNETGQSELSVPSQGSFSRFNRILHSFNAVPLSSTCIPMCWCLLLLYALHVWSTFQGLKFWVTFLSLISLLPTRHNNHYYLHSTAGS